MLALIGPLLFRRRPATIAGFVVPVVVYPVDAKAGRPIAHVLKECGEGSPPFADANATTAVFVPSAGPRICASLEHARPHRVDGGRPPIYLVSVGDGARPDPGRGQFPLQASAASRVSATKARDRHCSHRAALASAQPKPITFASKLPADCRQSAEPLSGNVEGARHG